MGAFEFVATLPAASIGFSDINDSKCGGSL